MNRTGLLAVVAVMMVAASTSFAQAPGAGGMGGVGGMGGGMGMAPGAMMQGGRGAGAGPVEVQRSAEVEMEGGQRLTGTIYLRPVVVHGDLGQYVIAPYKIKMIRFLKPIDDVKPVNGPEGNNNEDGGVGEEPVVVRRAARARAAVVRAGGGMGGGGAGGFGGVPAIRGKVITTTNKEIIGLVLIPTDFRLDLDFGTLALAPDKLRSITFTDDRREDKPGNAGATKPGVPTDPGRPAPGKEASMPRYFRQGSFVIVISSVGDRVTLYNIETKKSESLELSGSKDDPLEVIPVFNQNLIALMLRGPKVTRIAVADLASGTWHSQELRKPVEGRAVPIVGSGIVVYNLGRDVYAYGAETKSWDVAELPEGARAVPVVGPGFATIESDGHIYTFASETGKWDHVDIRAILDGAAQKRKQE